MQKAFLYIILIISLLSCKEEIDPQPKKGILFMGHTYSWHRGDNKVDQRLEHLDLSGYEQLWLGGDMCSETTKEKATLTYLDRLFSLGEHTTLWALGNHDYRNGNMDWLREKTGRPLHYLADFGGMKVLVTHTSYKETECEAKENQFRMIQRTCDTLRNASHLILMSHMLTWTDTEIEMDAKETANADKAWWPYTCEARTQFQRKIYPLLQAVQERGIQVVVISGDLGIKAKSYQYQSKDGIWFLASGINNSVEKDPIKRAQLPKDRLLYLEYDPIDSSLVWDFPILNELL
ncbi:MAG: hypothetical protein R8P61_14710 [Bacteroidia bacterium]|nr:hypothetical protein [Bacteroidia bacterium]